MRVGLTLPHYDFSLPDVRPITFEAVAEQAVRAERLGFDSVWVSDHFFASLDRYGGGDELYGTLEPLTTLAGLAARTERIRLGTLVLSAAFRHPAVLAKSATAVDRLSGGRLELGLGAGWYEDEFDAFGYPFGSVAERFDVLEETLAYVGALFDGEPASFEGERFRLQEAYNHPRPVQEPRPPLLVGGKGGPRLLRIAAQHADGWNAAWRWTPEVYAERAAAARQACERANRDPATFRLSLGLFTVVGEDEADLRRRFESIGRRLPAGVGEKIGLDTLRKECLAGTLDAVVERMASFAESGVSELIVCPSPVWFSMPDLSMVDLFAEGVLPALRDL
ncbi:MAG: LLM class flavin-dependent oxidoreductase [Actinomycetota bacterium]